MKSSYTIIIPADGSKWMQLDIVVKSALEWMNEWMNETINQMNHSVNSEKLSLHRQWVLCVPLIPHLNLCNFVVCLQYQLILAYRHQRLYIAPWEDNCEYWFGKGVESKVMAYCKIWFTFIERLKKTMIIISLSNCSAAPELSDMKFWY
jgi:hypothetical protein